MIPSSSSSTKSIIHVDIISLRLQQLRKKRDACLFFDKRIDHVAFILRFHYDTVRPLCLIAVQTKGWTGVTTKRKNYLFPRIQKRSETAFRHTSKITPITVHVMSSINGSEKRGIPAGPHQSDSDVKQRKSLPTVASPITQKVTVILTPEQGFCAPLFLV